MIKFLEYYNYMRISSPGLIASNNTTLTKDMKMIRREDEKEKEKCRASAPSGH